MLVEYSEEYPSQAEGISMTNPTTPEDFEAYVHAELNREGLRLNELVMTLQQVTLEQARVRELLTHRAETSERIEKSVGEMLVVFESWRGAMRVLETIGKIAKPMGYIAMFVSASLAGYVAFKQGFHRPI